jgi:hypothetical protein
MGRCPIKEANMIFILIIYTTTAVILIEHAIEAHHG